MGYPIYSEWSLHNYVYDHKVIKKKLSENAIFYFDVFCSTPGHRADWMGLDEQRILWSQKFEIQDAGVKDWREGC